MSKILLLFLILISVAHSMGGQELFVDSLGLYSFFDNEISIRVTRSTCGLLEYKVTRIPSQQSAGTPAPRINPQSHWFLYTESATRIWVYEGKKNLMRIQFIPASRTEKKTSTIFTDTACVPSLIKEAPSVVRDRYEKEIARKQ